MASTTTYLSHDVAVATITERVAITRTAEEATPEGTPLRAFLGDLRFTYEQIGEELARVSLRATVDQLLISTMISKAQGKVAFYVATSDALFALTGKAYVSRGDHG